MLLHCHGDALLRVKGILNLIGEPHPIARGQPVSRLGPSAVYAHLARSQDAIDQAAGHGAQGPQQEIIETLAVIAFLRLDVADLQMRVSH